MASRLRLFNLSMHTGHLYSILLHTFCNGPKQNREMASPLPMKCSSVVGRLMAWSPLCQVCQHLQMIVLQDLGKNPNGLRLCCWCSQASQDHGLLVGRSISVHPRFSFDRERHRQLTVMMSDGTMSDGTQPMEPMRRSQLGPFRNHGV